MLRTTILLPEELKAKIDLEVERRNLSFGEVVRRALQRFVLSQQEDPFLSSQTIFSDDGPHDGARRHDDYLAKEPVHGNSPK